VAHYFLIFIAVAGLGAQNYPPLKFPFVANRLNAEPCLTAHYRVA